MGFIIAIINYILWLPCKWILELLNGVQDVINFLATDLLETILFGSKVDDWSQVLIPATYYRILILAGACWLVFLGITFLLYLKKDIVDQDDTSFSKKIFLSLKHSSFAAILLIFIPLFVWILVKMTSILSEGLMIAFGGENISIGDMLYNLGNPKWDGTIKDMGGNYPAPSNLSQWNMVVELLGLCIVFLCLLLVMINIVVNIFATFFYFIMTGFYALTAVFDEGTRMKDYSKTMIANNLVVCSSMVIFNIYASLIMISFNATSNIPMNAFSRMLLQLALACGGGLFVVQGDQYVSRLVGENIAGTSNAMSGLGMLKAGIMTAGAIGYGAAKIGKNAMVGKTKGAKSPGGMNRNIGEASSREESIDINQKAKNNFDQGRQQAMQRYQSASGFSIMGISGKLAASTINTGRATKNVFGSFIGTKISRMMARAELKQQINSTKVGTKSVGGKVAKTAAIAVTAPLAMMGLNKTFNRSKVEKSKMFTNEDNLKKMKSVYTQQVEVKNEKQLGKINKKINKVDPKSISSGHIHTAKGWDLASKKLKVEKKNTKKLEKFDKKVNKYKDVKTED